MTKTLTKRPTTESAEEILNLYFPVLNHGFVSLVDYSGTDQCIEKAARVSYGAGTRKQSATRGLIRYLKRHRHTTPQEMIELKFHCCAPIFIMRQWIRHRMSSSNEYSGRYSLMPMLFYTPDNDRLQTQSIGNNQGSSGSSVSNEKYLEIINKWNDIRSQNIELYQSMTSEDIARELARIDLPLSTYTQWYWKIDLHNLLHFLTLRVDSHAQWEIQQYGEVIAGMLKRVAPLSYESWVDYNVCGTTLSRMERKILSNLNLNPKYDNKELSLTTDSKTYTYSEEESEMSSRELKELIAKLVSPKTPDFELDLSKAKSPKYFEDKMKAAVL